MQRRFDPATPELMDRPQPVSPELEQDLANIRRFNRWFGSYRLVRKFLRRWLRPNTSARILDLATGSGDIPRMVADFARRENVPVQIDAIDQQRATIEIARSLSAPYPEINFSCANLFEWDPPEQYDMVLFSLALHHFNEDNAVRVLQKCRQLSRGRVLVADLRRARWLSAGIWLVTATILREPMTKTDARLSAARAFGFAELRALAERAGWRNFGHERFAVGRQAVWLE